MTVNKDGVPSSKWLGTGILKQLSHQPSPVPCSLPHARTSLTSLHFAESLWGRQWDSLKEVTWLAQGLTAKSWKACVRYKSFRTDQYIKTIWLRRSLCFCYFTSFQAVVYLSLESSFGSLHLHGLSCGLQGLSEVGCMASNIGWICSVKSDASGPEQDK